ncbi:hypothetical protein NDU88_001164 [Pleurodeles waltl]|uniref:Uncharacterized protein n=1 Tax=Pleurodeles waltl TaxID=8319 RepID=A0AAV7UTX4_PLEWA|nr:hypothetical protein NDU88_001164 [Pleurodeles waltl]
MRLARETPCCEDLRTVARGYNTTQRGSNADAPPSGEMGEDRPRLLPEYISSAAYLAIAVRASIGPPTPHRFNYGRKDRNEPPGGQWPGEEHTPDPTPRRTQFRSASASPALSGLLHWGSCCQRKREYSAPSGSFLHHISALTEQRMYAGEKLPCCLPLTMSA